MRKLLKSLVLMKNLFISSKTLPEVRRIKRKNPNGKLFGLTRKLVKQHFPKGHKLHKIFNKNTIKVSYSCLKNMGSVLSRHNKIIPSRKENQYGCDCRNKAERPSGNNCLIKNYLPDRCLN